MERLNSVIRQATKKRKIFPTDDSVRKVVYLAIEAASKKWNMPIRDWRTAMSRFLIEFEDRLGVWGAMERRTDLRIFNGRSKWAQLSPSDCIMNIK